MSVESVESAGAAIGAEVRESSEVLSGTTAASKSMEGRAEGAIDVGLEIRYVAVDTVWDELLNAAADV